MELSLLLLKKIVVLLAIVIMGFISVKQGRLRSEDSTVLSRFAFDWLTPCSLINAFISTSAEEGLKTFLFISAVTLFAVLMYIGITILLGRALQLNPSEQGSLMFTNSASMALPMAAALLGGEYVIYCAPHMGIQNLFIFTLIPMIMNGKGAGGWRKVLLNRNLIAIFIGFFLFLTGIQLPEILTGIISTVGNTIGPVSMFMIGLLLGGVDFRALLRNRMLYLIAGLRLLVYPLIAIILIRVTGLAHRSPEAGTALLVLIMCVSAPVANLITQMADLYRPHEEAQEAGSINVFTTMFCCITMPIMALVYQLICL